MSDVASCFASRRSAVRFRLAPLQEDEALQALTRLWGFLVCRRGAIESTKSLPVGLFLMCIKG